MSHIVNDMIADQAMDQAIDKVNAMAFSAVSRQLLMRGKGTQFLAGPLEDAGKARDALIDQLAEDILEDLMERPGPHG
tara:strand:- start:3745 stop:3978 length:234 start_codon:yes stop_codon:yes gene_type:complete